jgi:hypothetical protein
MAADLARIRNVPLSVGRTQTWACAIAYTVGDLNFLYAPNRRPRWRGTDVCALLGVSQSAVCLRRRRSVALRHRLTGFGASVGCIRTGLRQFGRLLPILGLQQRQRYAEAVGLAGRKERSPKRSSSPAGSRGRGSPRFWT